MQEEKIMFIKTENNGVINLNHYPRIGVYSQYNRDPYFLCAFTKQTSGGEHHERINIAKFSEEADVNYAICSLLNAIDAGESIWDPQAISSFSHLWKKAKEKISSVAGVPQASLEKLHLSISGPRKITIAYALRGASGGGPLGLSEEQPVAETLKTVLEAEEPNGAEWIIDFQDVEDQS